MEVPEFIYSKKIGETLTRSQRTQLSGFISQLRFNAIHNRRYKRLPMPERMIQNSVLSFFSFLGYRVKDEVTLKVKGLIEQKMVFDVVVENKKNRYLIEVKKDINPRDIGQVKGYSIALKINKIKGKIYLCTDIVSTPSILKEITGIMLKELMEKENVGLIFLDKTHMIVFDNYPQLELKRMPQFLFF